MTNGGQAAETHSGLSRYPITKWNLKAMWIALNSETEEIKRGNPVLPKDQHAMLVEAFTIFPECVKSGKPTVTDSRTKGKRINAMKYNPCVEDFEDTSCSDTESRDVQTTDVQTLKELTAWLSVHFG